jgi:hypothetical protein
MRDEFRCVLSKTKLEAYIGRHDDDTLIEIALSEPLGDAASVCMRPADARELAATLIDLAERLERHLAKNQGTE